jgi:ABC-type sugar transport system permease subunit
MLDTLDVASAPAGAMMQILFLPLIVVFAVVAVLFAFLFMRNRGKVSYFRLVIEDQIKDLEGLTLRASKIDRTISSSLETVEERLKRLVGM